MLQRKDDNLKKGNCVFFMMSSKVSTYLKILNFLECHMVEFFAKDIQSYLVCILHKVHHLAECVNK